MNVATAAFMCLERAALLLQPAPEFGVFQMDSSQVNGKSGLIAFSSIGPDWLNCHIRPPLDIAGERDDQNRSSV